VTAYQRSIAWIAAAAFLVVMLLLLREILLPFLVGVALAYLLDPIVKRLESVGLSRGGAAFGLIALFYVSAIALVVVLAPLLAEEVAIFIDKFPGYLSQLQALATDPGRPLLRKIVSEGLAEAQRSTGELTSFGANLGARLVHLLWSDGQALISVFSLLVVAPIVTFYLLVDWEHILAMLDRLVPPTQRETVRGLAREINDTIALFIRGQGIICLALALYYAVALRLTGLNHALLIGLVSGLVSFAPYLGLLTGLVLSIGVALIQFWPDWSSAPVILGIFIVGQVVADYVLAPRLIGETLKLSPVLMLFAIAAFGSLFGFVGLLIAVPLAAALGVVARFAMSHGAEELFVEPHLAATADASPALAPRPRRGWF
jgi:predicted PurR-regulated permease PerM